MSSPHILVVEDEAVVAMDIEQSLKKLGYEVSVASSGPEAIASAEAKLPDIALMDIMLADGPDGIETAKCLRERFGIASIYLTANADDDTIERAKQTEPAGYILKPFRERELHTTVQMALARISLERRMKQRDNWHTVVLQTLHDPVITVAKDCTVTFMNQAAEEMANCLPNAAIGKDCTELLPGLRTKRPEVARRLTQVLREGVTQTIADCVLTQAGDDARLYAGDSIVPLVGEQGDVSGAVIVFRNPPGGETGCATQNGGGTVPRAGQASTKVSEPAAAGLADAATGLPGRAQAEQALAQAIRRKKRAFVAMVTVDRFETIQERFGKTAADEVLLFMSRHLAHELSDKDRLFRWSGPNFLVLLERVEPLEDVRTEVARLASMKLEKLLRLGVRSAMVFLSARWTVHPVYMSVSADELVVQLDKTLGG